MALCDRVGGAGARLTRRGVPSDGSVASGWWLGRSSAMNQSNWMIPDARESWVPLLYKESKIIENRRVLFAGDDFENIAFLNIDENPLVLLTFHWKPNDNNPIFIGFPIQIWHQNPETFYFRKYFSKSSPAKSTRRFSMFFDSWWSRDRQLSRAPGIIQFEWFIAEESQQTWVGHH